MRTAMRLELEPIGFARTPFAERSSAPRQAVAARDVEATIELVPGRDFEHALEDLEGWSHLWVVFWFHLNEGWRPKVLPPRSEHRRGLFATRSPHRPNPIGLSLVRLVAVEGLTVRVRDVDLVDGTPVLDLKPYVPYADSVPDARTGWLAEVAEGGAGAPAAPIDDGRRFAVRFAPEARAQVAWIRERLGVDLETPVVSALALGPQPHPYRRIRKDGDLLRLAWKDWRVRFRVEGREVTVLQVLSGWRPRELATGDDPAIAPHRAFVEAFPGAIAPPPRGG